MTATPVDLETRVRTLESRSERHDEDIKAISDTVVETRDEVKALSVQVRELRSDVDVLTTRVDGLDLKVDGLDQKVDGLTQDVGWLKRGMTAIITHLGLNVEPDNRDS